MEADRTGVQMVRARRRDNKGQHSIGIAALQAVLETRGNLGFNAKYLIEMGEEVGSPGLRELSTTREDLFRADVLIASDGPRLSADRPTVFLGSRGCVTFDMRIEARRGSHHSGNWGGLLSDPAIQLAHAIASIVQPTGKIRVPEWLPRDIPENVRRILADCEVESGAEERKIEPDWGEPGLTSAEKVFGWSSFTVLAFEAGNPKNPVKLSRREPGPAASCASWSGSTNRTYCQRCAATSTGTAFQWCRLQSRAARFFTRRGLIRIVPGSVGRSTRSPAPPGRVRPSCRTSVGRCPTTSSPLSSSFPLFGCRTPIRHVPSTHRTSIYRLRSPARASRLWPASTGTLVSRACHRFVTETVSERRQMPPRGATYAFSLKTAFSRFPPFHRADPEGRLRVNSSCLTGPKRLVPNVRFAPLERAAAKLNRLRIPKSAKF